MNVNIKILGIVLVFFISVGTSFIVSNLVENKLASNNTASEENVISFGDIYQDGGSSDSGFASVDEDEFSSKNIMPQTIETTTVVDTVATEVVMAEEETQSKVDSVNIPVIASAKVQALQSKNYKKIGRVFNVSATVASGDVLEYRLYSKDNTNTVLYTSANGTFNDVLPVNDGKYLLRVVNTRTNDYAEQIVGGFNKISKWNAQTLESQLNAPMIGTAQDKMFYFHFDIDHLEIIWEGDTPSQAPTDLDALMAAAPANGWTYKIIGTPKYDQYNRIVSFQIKPM